MKFKVVKSLFQQNSDYVIEKIVPYYYSVYKLKNSDFNRNLFDAIPIKRWVVKKAHEMGYDVKLHGSYDRSVCDNFRLPDVERIGKKYQWIAYYEILSRLTDNHKVKNWNNEYRFYEGPWEFYARDIDPAYTTKNTEELPKDDMKILKSNPEWWNDPDYSFWNQEHAEWARNINDLPDVKHVINKRDSSGTQWLFLNKYATWNMPKPIGVDKYSMFRKEIWYMLQGYIIKKKDKGKIIKFLKDKNFWGRWMPESSEESNQLLNREKYWSPAYNSSEREDSWEEIYFEHESTGLLVLPSTENAKASISGDKSGAESSYSIPCKKLFNDLGLIYAPKDGNLVNDQGELVVQNITHSRGLMINKKILMEYLEKNNLEIIWTLLGEKMVYFSHREQSYFSTPCGMFYLENNEIQGQLHHYERN